MWMDATGPGPQFHEYLFSVLAGVGNFEYSDESESLLLFDIQLIMGLIIFPARNSKSRGEGTGKRWPLGRW